jgi:hypothetical protein
MRQRLATEFPSVNEANLIAEELEKKTVFTPKILNVLPRKATEEDLNSDSWDKRLCIEVVNYEYQLIWIWDLDRFENRLNMMRELMEDYRATNRLPQLSPENDPYWDPPEEHLIGVAYYSLKPLALLFDNPFDLRIVSTAGGEAGNVKVNIVPIDEDGNPLEEGPESPEELIGTQINFRVEVIEARGLPATHANNVSCKYEIFNFGEKSTNIITTADALNVFKFDYSEEYRDILVTEEMYRYMQNFMMWFEIRGTGKTVRPPSIASSPRANKPAVSSAFANVSASANGSSVEEALEAKRKVPPFVADENPRPARNKSKTEPGTKPKAKQDKCVIS